MSFGLVARHANRLVTISPSYPHALANPRIRTNDGSSTVSSALLGFRQHQFTHAPGPQRSHNA